MGHRKFGFAAALLLGMAFTGSSFAATHQAAPPAPAAITTAHLTVPMTGQTQPAAFPSVTTGSSFVKNSVAMVKQPCEPVTPENFCSCYPEHCGHD